MIHRRVRGENPFCPLVHSRTLLPVREADDASGVGRQTNWKKYIVSNWGLGRLAATTKQINKTTTLRSGIAQTLTGPTVATHTFTIVHTYTSFQFTLVQFFHLQIIIFLELDRASLQGTISSGIGYELTFEYESTFSVYELTYVQDDLCTT